MRNHLSWPSVLLHLHPNEPLQFIDLLICNLKGFEIGAWSLKHLRIFLGNEEIVNFSLECCLLSDLNLLFSNTHRLIVHDRLQDIIYFLVDICFFLIVAPLLVRPECCIHARGEHIVCLFRVEAIRNLVVIFNAVNILTHLIIVDLVFRFMLVHLG